MNKVTVIEEESSITIFDWKIDVQPEETTKILAKDKAPLPEGKPKGKIKAVLG